MVYKLFNIGRNSGIVAIFFLLINALDCSSTEYVFTAPPESGREVLEIPESDAEYPLYECENDSTTAEKYISDSYLDSHDCVCVDCETMPKNADSEQQYTTSETEADS